MKLLLIGATGPLGRELVKQSLAAGHTVTALVRGRADLPAGVLVCKGDVLDPKSLEAAVRGQEAVVSALGVKMGVKEPVVSEGTRNLVAAMERHQVKRLLCVTALGVAESKRDTSLLGKFGSSTFLKAMFADKARQEEIIKQSTLDWTIVRPTILTNKPATGHYRVGLRLRLGLVATVPRADVADFILGQLSDSTYLHKTLAVSL